MAAAPEVQATSAIASVPLYYNRAGFDDVVGKTFGLEGGLGLAYSLDVELTDYIWHLTSGHSQAVGLVFQSLADYFKYRDFQKRSLTVTFDDAEDFLANDISLLTSLRNNIHRAKVVAATNSMESANL